MIKNIGISGTPEEIQIISKLLELEGYEVSKIDNDRDINDTYLYTYSLKAYSSYTYDIPSLGDRENKKEFKASEFDQAYQYLFDKELFSKEYLKGKDIIFHCKNETEWNNISNLYNYKWASCNNWDIYKNQSCINTNRGEANSYGYLNLYSYKDYTIIPASFVLNLKSKTMNTKKKIVGYIAPYDIYCHMNKPERINKGDILVQKQVNGGYYHTKECNSASYLLAKEIVEKFEPIFEQEEVILNIGNPKQGVTINQHGITCDNRTMKFESLIKINEHLNQKRIIATETGWEVLCTEVKIGCSKFSIEEFNQVFEASKKFTS